MSLEERRTAANIAKLPELFSQILTTAWFVATFFIGLDGL